MLWSYTQAIDEILGYYYRKHKVHLRRIRIQHLRYYRQVVKKKQLNNFIMLKFC